MHWYSSHLCSINWGDHSGKIGSSSKFVKLPFKASILDVSTGRVYLPKYVHLPSFVYWYSSHLCYINWGVHWPKKGLSDKYEHTSKLLLNNFQCNCLQEIHSCLGGPLAKVGLSAKFSVAVIKASILDLLGVSIGQSRFPCQVWCSRIQGIYSQFTGGSPSAKVGLSANFGIAVFKASMLDSLAWYCISHS